MSQAVPIQQRFERSISGRFLGSPTAVTLIIPGPDFLHVWDVTAISVFSDSVLIPKAQVYKNSVSPSNFISATVYGIQDTDDKPNLQLSSGEQLVTAAQLGTLNSTFTVRIMGIETYYRR